MDFVFKDPYNGKIRKGKDLRIIADEGATYARLDIKFENRVGYYPISYPIEDWSKAQESGESSQ